MLAKVRAVAASATLEDKELFDTIIARASGGRRVSGAPMSSDASQHQRQCLAQHGSKWPGRARP
jgi:hypothetical protein